MLSIDIGLCSPETKRQETGLSATNVGSLSPLKGFAGQSPTVRAIDDRESQNLTPGRYTGDELQLSEKDEKDEEDSSQSLGSKSDSKIEEIKDADDSMNELGVEEIEVVKGNNEAFALKLN